MKNFMSTILSAFKDWTKTEIKDSTADWNQNDSSANNYVKNRTHWTDDNGVIHTLDEKYIPNTIVRVEDIPVPVQPDWSQNDPTAADFIKNKSIEMTNDDALNLLSELSVVEPVTNEYGAVFTNENGVIYVL